MRESNIRHPNYRGYISVVCEGCGHKSVSPAGRYKRNRNNLILCPETTCYEVVKANPLPTEERTCPVCNIKFSSTNPSRIYCDPGCRKIAQDMRKEAKKIHTGKKRKRAVDEIFDFLNG